MKKLFGVFDNYGNGKQQGEWFQNKMAAKARRFILNGGEEITDPPRKFQLRVGPDHWRYM